MALDKWVVERTGKRRQVASLISEGRGWPIHFGPALMRSSSPTTAGQASPALQRLWEQAQGGHNAATGALPSSAATWVLENY